MVKVKDVCRELEAFAPLALKMDFDNVGFLVGFSDNSVERILVTLDITQETITEAITIGAQLIVSHHPLFFSLKSVTDKDTTGKKITMLLSHNISAICMHTNLDAAAGGVNDALAETAGLTQTMLLSEEVFDGDGTPHSYGRVGYLNERSTMGDYLNTLCRSLNTNGLRYHDAGRQVHKVATVGGSGGGYILEAFAQGCDTLVTADVKYDVFLQARELGINLIDGDHYCTENVVIPVLAERLVKLFPDTDIRITQCHSQTAKFFCESK